MTWRSLLWRTLKATLLRPYFTARHKRCLRRIADLEWSLRADEIVAGRREWAAEMFYSDGVDSTDFSLAPGSVIPIKPGGSIYYIAAPKEAA